MALLYKLLSTKSWGGYLHPQWKSSNQKYNLNHPFYFFRSFVFGANYMTTEKVRVLFCSYMHVEQPIDDVLKLVQSLDFIG